MRVFRFSSHSTTCLIVGRLKGFRLTHIQATSSIFFISSSKPFSLRSKNFDRPFSSHQFEHHNAKTIHVSSQSSHPCLPVFWRNISQCTD